jgi:C1A family cysteine protease
LRYGLITHSQQIALKTWGVRDEGGEVQDQGHFYMPYGYLENHNLAESFWTARMIYAFL